MSVNSKLLAVLKVCFALFGFFIIACLVVMSGIAVYVWTQEPMRFAANRAIFIQISPAETNVVLVTDTIITPQPLQVSLAETNVVLSNPELEAYLNGEVTNATIWIKTNMVLINPPIEAYLNGAVSNAAIWTNGKSFQSGGPAAWELVKAASPLWWTGSGTVVCGLLLRRYRSRVGASINSPDTKTMEEYVHR